MRNLLSMLRPFDGVIVFSLVLFSFLPALIFSQQHAVSEDEILYAVISINGEEVDRFQLTGNTKHEFIRYEPSPGQYNIVEIDGERIRNKEDNSPHQIAVQTGWIDKPGQTSLNIPHRLLIEIISENQTEEEVDVIS